MPVSPHSHAPALDFNRLIFDAIDQALKHEDAQKFLAWMQKSIGRYLPPDVTTAEQPDKSFAVQLGRSFWNAIPLPGNHFKPRPLPEPGRNAACICGSGKKYKHCCAQAQLPSELTTDLFGPMVLLRVPAKRVQQGIADQEIPIQSLVLAGQMAAELNQARKGIRILEPVFAEPIQKIDENAEFALDTLCDLYDETGAEAKKMRLLERIIATVKRSPLKSGAQQRLATICMDRGDAETAWEIFQKIQQDTPNSPTVGLLETQLLLGEGRLNEAQARAQFWYKRLQRQGQDKDEPALEFLAQLAKDPRQAMSELALDMAEGAGERLQRWVQMHAQRPLPSYAVVDQHAYQDEPANPDELAETLRQMGVAPDQLEGTVAQLWEQIETLSHHDSEDEPDGFKQEPDSLFLEPPEKLMDLEQEWMDVFPLEKPFSTQEAPFGKLSAWEPELEDQWMSFLEAHPDAFDSLEILDDIATALHQHPSFGLPWFDQTVLEPVLRRAEAILRQSLQASKQPRLLWGFGENRPLLRSLARLANLYLRHGDHTAALPLMTWLLELNPNDNHGFREEVMNNYLRRGEDQKALALSNRYPDDMSPDLTYGRVLALYRLNRSDEAQTALCTAQERLPKIIRYLVNKRVRKPKLDNYGVRMGGDDQAWLYREEMRAVWQQTEGALDWLKAAAKRCSST